MAKAKRGKKAGSRVKSKPKQRPAKAKKSSTRPKRRTRMHVFIHSSRPIVKRAAPAARGFDYPTTLRRSTAHFKVYYDPNLGANGPVIAEAVLATCESDYSILQTYFGGITPPGLPFNIITAAGIGGAYHWGCGAVDLYCDADTSPSPDVDHTRMLVVAEEVEVFSAAQGSRAGDSIPEAGATDTQAGKWLRAFAS